MYALVQTNSQTEIEQGPEMAQWVEELAKAKPDDLTSIFGLYMMEGEN